MATTLTNFLIGLGMDTTDFKRGEKSVVSGIGSIRSQILQLGAVAGGAFGLKALTFDFANATDSISKFSQVFGGTPEDIQAFGLALEKEGGSIESLMGQLENLARLRAMTPAQVGGLFAEAGIRGINPSVILNAKSATDAYMALADVMERLSPMQRLQVADVFGLDEASIRLLSQGGDVVQSLIDRQREIRPLTEGMTQSARAFRLEWLEAKNNILGVRDAISEELIPVVTGLFKFTNETFNLWREGVKVTDIIGETSPGGRLSAEATFGVGASWLDQPISNPDVARALMPLNLQNDIPQIFSGDSGAQPTFNDPNTKSIADDMLTRQRQQLGLSPLEVKVYNRIELDGQKIDQRIDTRTEMQYTQALNEIESSNGG